VAAVSWLLCGGDNESVNKWKSIPALSSSKAFHRQRRRQQQQLTIEYQEKNLIEVSNGDG